MRSIRRRLLWSLIGGCGLLVLAAGFGSSLLVERHLRAEFDRSLLTKAQALVTLTVQQAGEVELDFADEFMPEFEAHEPVEYFELWLAGGTVLERSRSLAERDLPRFADLARAPRCRDLRLPDGRPGRLIEIAFVPQLEDDAAVTESAADPGAPPGELTSAVLVVARGREELETVVHRLRATTVGIALLLLAGIAALVHRAVAGGLEPLSQIGRQVQALDASRLGRRVAIQPAVAELAPIVAQLNALLARLEAALERERRFSSDVAHELRTPVAELRNLAEVGERWPDDRESVQAFFADVGEIAKQMQRTVTTLLALTRLEGGLEQTEAAELSVPELITSTWASLEPEATARGLRLELAGAAPPIVADREKLGIILANLLSNAVAYSLPGSTVAAGVRVEGGGLEITIENPAPHLTPSDLPLLFERFWRKDAARTSGQHTGLGLALARSLATLLGLELTAALSPDHRLTLRLAGKLGMGPQLKKKETP